jgi:hypothetical protein
VTTTNAHQFVQAILAACNTGHDDVAFEAATASIRRALVAFGSETPDNLACAAQVDLGPSVGRPHGPERTIGLRLAGTNVVVSDIMYEAGGRPSPRRCAAPFPSSPRRRGTLSACRDADPALA